MPALGCTSSESFRRERDEQCIADDVQGICTEVENCAYPDPNCETGYSFPVGSGYSGGMCVQPLPGSTTATSSTSTTGAASTTGTTEVGPSTGAGSSTTGVLCQDDGDDDLASAFPLMPGSCNFEVQGVVDRLDDVDWYGIDLGDPTEFCAEDSDPGDLSVDVVGARTCAYIACSDPSVVYCVDGVEDQAGDNLPGCCSDQVGERLELGADAPCDPTDQVYVMVQADPNAACGELYTTNVELF